MGHSRIGATAARLRSTVDLGMARIRPGGRDSCRSRSRVGADTSSGGRGPAGLARHNPGTSEPYPPGYVQERLTHIARKIVARYGRRRFEDAGLVLEDLVHTGWLALHESLTWAGRDLAWRRTAWAMEAEARSPERGMAYDHEPGATYLTDQDVLSKADPEDFRPSWNVGVSAVRKWRLGRSQIRDLQALCRRVLLESERQVMEGLLIGGETIESYATMRGLASSTVRSARSRALRKLQQAIAAPRN